MTVVVQHLNVVDIISETLSRLCVKDLKRFKSVSMISIQKFIHLHLKNSRFRTIPLQPTYTSPGLGTLGGVPNLRVRLYNHFNELGTLFSGNVHWAAYATATLEYSCLVILSYNLMQEEVEAIPVPVDTVKN